MVGGDMVANLDGWACGVKTALCWQNRKRTSTTCVDAQANGPQFKEISFAR
jgi:hypothetical protein